MKDMQDEGEAMLALFEEYIKQENLETADISEKLKLIHKSKSLAVE